jgi:excisionase family DNA binding protein
MRSERSREWLRIHEASAMIGVSTATLRRWCDAGDVRAFTTPGGHRRFARAAILGMLPAASRIRPTMGGLGQTAESITRAYRREACPSMTWPPAIEALAPSAREPFRECGRAIVGALAAYLDAAGSCEAAPGLAVAKSAAARHGLLAATHGVGLGGTVELFLRLRAPFLHELGAVARRKGLDTTAAMDLLEAATDVIDGLMPSLMAGHAAGTEARGGGATAQASCATTGRQAGQAAPGTGVLDVPEAGSVGHSDAQAVDRARRGKGQAVPSCVTWNNRVTTE